MAETEEAEEKPLDKLEFELEVGEMERSSIASARIILKGGSVSGRDEFMKITLATLPYIAKQIPLTSKWRVTLERIE